ncbi:hypothetical protein JMJ77_0005767 [Colletotrichum scovillei]|uniref:Uncharacterized protein n=1 Tax=Colletotrichum scovillei TaxID=1209932 RepID=A0A9P7UIK3_9PEZI|nr:hypothetical protein JMJ77_0005767 [Colletotrichum scovillei]KAG7076970.1 hypothetical protein JMJ76_0014226 [Colletotrichum scovillei]
MQASDSSVSLSVISRQEASNLSDCASPEGCTYPVRTSSSYLTLPDPTARLYLTRFVRSAPTTGQAAVTELLKLSAAGWREALADDRTTKNCCTNTLYLFLIG